MNKKTVKTFLREIRVYALIRIWDMTIVKKGELYFEFKEFYTRYGIFCILVLFLLLNGVGVSF